MKRRAAPRNSGPRGGRVSGGLLSDDAFIEAVLATVEAIPPGKVLAYGDVAELIGRGGPRSVGAVMSGHGAGVPWWRVVPASGRLAPHLAERQATLLRHEGTDVVDGRIRA